MTALLRDEPKDAPPPTPGPAAWLVGGVRHANSAAKFWMTLLDETRTLYPEADRIELATTGSGPLERRYLSPEQVLQEDLDRLCDTDLAEAMRSALAELELTGPPSPVRARILAGDRELLTRELPADILDSEILPFLLAWLLEWAGIPDFMWNNEFLSGSFAAEARRAYSVRFDLVRRHLSEGLFEITLTLAAERLTDGETQRNGSTP